VEDVPGGSRGVPAAEEQRPAVLGRGGGAASRGSLWQYGSSPARFWAWRRGGVEGIA
jgi:hypothetical protein